MHPKDQVSLIEDMKEIVRVLDANDIDYALCGGLAVAIHGYVRFTQDIDIIILPEDLEKAKAVLKKTGYNLPSGLIPFKQKDGSFWEIFRLSKAMGKELYTLALMLCTGSLEEKWQDRELVEADDQEFKVVSKAGLISMKKEAGRNKDLLDIEELENLG
jgi:hypothetical protein